MERFYFEEKRITDDFRFVFLCGVDYSTKEEDKRNVLADYLKEKKSSYKPIILEQKFGLEKKIPDVLSYGDIYLRNLYEIETLTTYLSDAIIIIHESISTGAETGLFLGNTEAAKKSCLLVPDKYAVEEEKIGTFIKLAFFLEPSMVSKIDFYPSVEKYMLSSNCKKWHTYFPQNKIGDVLGRKILDFLEKSYSSKAISFTNNLKDIPKGKIYFKLVDDTVHIKLRPSILSICVASLFNLKEIRENIFSEALKKVSEIVAELKKDLEEVFVCSIEEKKGIVLAGYKCKIEPDINIKDVSIQSCIGLIFYFFQAAQFIEIKKAEDYEESALVTVKEKMVQMGENYGHFYEKYKDIIKRVSEKRIE